MAQFAETELGHLLTETRLIITDTTHQKMSQKEKITKYRQGSQKIKDSIKCLEEIKAHVTTLNTEGFDVDRHQKLSNVMKTIETTSMPGSSIDDLFSAIISLQSIFNQINTVPSIVENAEKDIIVDQHSIDVYAR